MSIPNAPAEPCDLFREELDDLLIEAKNYIDGEGVASEQEAEAIAALVNRARRIGNDADDARKAEKKPHDDIVKGIQAKWRPVLDTADLILATAKEALSPWLVKVEERQRAEAETARLEAERMAMLASDALAASYGNIQARDDAERLLKAAGAAERHAAKAGKQKAHATGGERVVGLVDRFTPELVDSCAALKHYRATQPELLKAWLVDQARKDVHAGARVIPGFEIHHERKAR